MSDLPELDPDEIDLADDDESQTAGDTPVEEIDWVAVQALQDRYDEIEAIEDPYHRLEAARYLAKELNLG